MLLRWVALVLLGASAVAAAASSCDRDTIVGASDAGLGLGPDGARAAGPSPPLPLAAADSASADGPTEDADAPLRAGEPCADAGRACEPGFGCCVPCCISGRAPVCTLLSNVIGHSGKCPLPDLTVNESALAASVVVDNTVAGTCELSEGCLGDEGPRRVLRFDVRIANSGGADLVLGDPDGSAEFQYSPCHMHYHFGDFATYRLLDDAGAAVVTGRKQAFCARDSDRVGIFASPRPKYDCSLQGISVGWEDDYAASLPCQWLDVSGVAPGPYVLEVEVNPVRKMTELSYDNNRVRVPVTIPTP